MQSHTTKRFRQAFDNLPEIVQNNARRAYQLWKVDPFHPSLKFKLIQPVEQVYSIRIGRGWRALGVREGDTITWFWIGSHSDYDKLINYL